MNVKSVVHEALLATFVASLWYIAVPLVFSYDWWKCCTDRGYRNARRDFADGIECSYEEYR